MATFTREQVLQLATQLDDDADEARVELLSTVSMFDIGDEVRHQDSPRESVNKCEVVDMKVVGFPETSGPLEIAYELDCPGAEGVGRESHWVVGGADLVQFDYQDPRELAEAYPGPFAYVDPEDIDYPAPWNGPVPVLVQTVDQDTAEGIVVAMVIDSDGETYMVPAGLLFDPKPTVPGSGS